MTAIGYHFTSSTDVELAVVGRRGKHFGEHRAHRGPQPLGGARRERLSDESPEACVLLAVDAEDPLADLVPELALGDALRSKCETRGREVATVAEHGLRGLVAQRLDAERTAGKGTTPQRFSKHPVRVELELFAEAVELRQVFDGRHDETVDGVVSVEPEPEESVPDPHTVRPYSSRRRLMSSNTVEP